MEINHTNLKVYLVYVLLCTFVRIKHHITFCADPKMAKVANKYPVTEVEVQILMFKKTGKS